MNPFVDQWSQQNSNYLPNYNSESTNENFSETITNVTTSKNTIQQAKTNISNDTTPKNLSSKISKDLFNYDEIFVAKFFYLLFYAAFGSLFPLMAVYYKQQGMSATQTGLLIGIRPFIEIFSTPFWVNLANRFSKGKVVLIGSLISWIILTSALAFIRPPVAACITNNGTNFVLYLPYLEDNIMKQDNLNNVRKKRSNFWDSKLEKIKLFKSGLAHYSIYQNKKKNEIINYMDDPDYSENLDNNNYLPPNHVIGVSPLTIEYSVNYDDKIHSEFISPTFSQTVYKKNKVDEVFTLLMLLVLIGEFFAAPTITLVDTVTIKHLSCNINSYSKLRIFGSVGWALAMLFIGMALDNSTYFYKHPCGPHLKERNYNVCFKIFAILMTIACIVATKFNFEYNFSESSIEMSANEVDKNIKKEEFFNKLESGKTLNTADKKQNDRKKTKFEFLDELKSGVFAQSFNKKLEFFPLLKCLTSPKLVALMFLAWFMGSGVGLVFSFLFWHLQDLGGTPSLFGLASVINHISEIAAYFGSLNYIKKYGHSRILCLGLICNFLRFLYISYIDNPWLILPFELVQGITHATVWATFCSYFNHTIPENSKNTSQALLQTIYNGFGKGLGSIFGGFLITAYGTRVTFAIYAFSSLITIGIFFLVMNVYNKQLIPTINLADKKFEMSNNDKTEKSETVNEYVTGLIPHGVPTGPINYSNNTKVFTQTTIINDKAKTSTYDDDLVEDYIKTNHRDWKITMNKHYQ